MAWGSCLWWCLSYQRKSTLNILILLSLCIPFLVLTDGHSLMNKRLTDVDYNNSPVIRVVRRGDSTRDEHHLPSPVKVSSVSPSPKAVSSEVRQGKESTSIQDLQVPPHAALQDVQNSLVNSTAKKQLIDASSAVDPDEGEMGIGPGKGLSSDAVIRLFYVFVGVGVIILIYILIKLLRMRRRRAARKYRVLAHSDDQEMFPLAADDGDDEEIFNAADHQTQK